MISRRAGNRITWRQPKPGIGRVLFVDNFKSVRKFSLPACTCRLKDVVTLRRNGRVEPRGWKPIEESEPLRHAGMELVAAPGLMHNEQ